MKNKKYIVHAILSSLLFSLAVILSFVTSTNSVVRSYSESKVYTFTLDNSNYGFLPTSSGSGTSTQVNSPRTSNGNPIIFSYTNAQQRNTRIRLAANSGALANNTPFSGLRAITIKTYSGAVSLCYGDSTSSYCDPIQVTSEVRYEIDSKPYFKITAGTSIAQITYITVEYTCDGSGELDPVQPHVHNGYHYLAKEPTQFEPGNKEFYACSECEYVSLTKEDEGTYVDTVLTYELPPEHIAYIAPSMLRQPAQYPYPIAVSLAIPSSGYEADPTGVVDATSTIQSALNYVSSLGGGTLYISSGKYLISSQIHIPSRVTLVGEFNGPDADDYGTVFLCTMPHSGTDIVAESAQIVVFSNAGINGVTFYYPNQDVTSVTTYGYTVYAYHNLAASLSNLLFINSYNGISVNDVNDAGGGELVCIENIYGTFLNNAISGYYQSDAGNWNNINISPSYYENAISEYRCSNVTALYKYTRTNLVALTLGDLDDFSFDHINIDNAKIGIYFPVEVVRPLQAFWGLLNDVNISDCLTGVYATRLFSGCGVIFTHSSLGKVINVATEGVLKLSKCRYDELLSTGDTIIEYGSETYQVTPAHDDSHVFNIPARVYYIDSLDTTGVNDVSSALQTEINKCTDGGVIVIKNGTYRLNNPISVPANTMLTSFANSFSRTTNTESQNELVKFISYSDEACVKLSKNAGINGIRMYNVYRDPDMAYNLLSNSNTDSFVMVKALDDGCFALNSEASYTFTGFDFTGSSNHYIKYCYGSAYETFIKASESGKLISSLTNLTFLARNCLHDFAQDNLTALNKYYNFEDDSKEEAHDKARDITRTYCTMIKLTGGNEQVLGCFSYGIKTLIESNNASLLALNTSQDNLKDTSYMYIINGGDAKIVSSVRVFGSSFNLISGHLEAYGRLDFINKYEKYYNSSSSTDDSPDSPIRGLDEDVLSYCESTTGFSNATRNSSYKVQGSYSLRANSTGNPAIFYRFSARDISSYMRHGYLRFYIYIANISSKGNEYSVELTSSNNCDADEITYNFMDQVTKTGWNEIIVKLSSMSNSVGTFNPSALNYFRFYANGTNCYHYLDYISFFHEPISNNEIILSECESLSGSGAVTLSDFRMEGSYSYQSTDTTNATFVYMFNNTDISAYMSTGSLSFYFYVPNRDTLGDVVYVELTSSGIWDNQEITCNVKPYILEDGWNHVQIPLSSFYQSGEGTFDSTKLNFFRLYTLNSDSYFYLDDIRLVK